MVSIGLQHKTRACSGQLMTYWFENKFINLPRTLFFRIVIQLVPFDSGLEYMAQPEETEIVIDWIKLDAPSVDAVNGFLLGTGSPVSYESTIYIGSAHNPVEFEWLELTRISHEEFMLKGRASIDFEFESIGENESFDVETIIKAVVA